MSIAEDLKQAYQEVGYPCSVEDSGTGQIYSGEYILSDVNAQVTKPFIREFFLEGEMPYDTKAKVGSIIHISGENDYIVAHLSPEMVLAEQINRAVVFYKCNVSGELKRSSGEDWNNEYHKVPNFVTVKSKAYALLTDSLFGTMLSEQREGLISIHKNEMYLPSTYGAKVLDRYEPISGERFLVSTVQKYRFTGVDFLTLEEDTR